RALDQPPELVAHSLDPGALAEELGHRAHRAPHVTPTGQLGVQTLTTRTPLTTALSGRNSLIPCEFHLVPALRPVTGHDRPSAQRSRRRDGGGDRFGAVDRAHPRDGPGA